MTIPVRSDISPSAHPDAVLKLAEVLDVENSIGRSMYHDTRSGLERVYTTLATINDAEVALARYKAATAPARRRQHPDGTSDYLGDLRMYPDGKIRQYSDQDEELYEMSANAIQQALKDVDKKSKRLAMNKAALVKQVAEDLRNSGLNESVYAEIRSHLKSLPDMKRAQFIDEAISAKDKATIHAIFHAPPFLSGITPEQREAYYDRAAHVMSPQHWGQSKALDKLVEALNRAGGVALTRMVQLKDLQTEERDAARKTKAKVAALAK